MIGAQLSSILNQTFTYVAQSYIRVVLGPKLKLKNKIKKKKKKKRIKIKTYMHKSWVLDEA